MIEVDALATGAHVVVPCTVLIQIAGTGAGWARVRCQEELDLVLSVPCNVHGCGVM
jgi:hypothetical protein